MRTASISQNTRSVDAAVSPYKPNSPEDLTAFWLRSVQSHRFGTYDSLPILRSLRERVGLFPDELHDCIQPVIDALDELFSSNRLFSPNLQSALNESFKRLDRLCSDPSRST